MKSPVEEEELLAVKNKFPNLDERIMTLFTGNKDFRHLCRDYFLCTNHMEKLEKELNKKRAWMLDYKDERGKLENELLRTLSEMEIDATIQGL
jgi:hypothetical protein